MAHPQAGPLRVNCDILSVPDDDQRVVFITADPGSASARALRHLAAAIPARGYPGRMPASRFPAGRAPAREASFRPGATGGGHRTGGG